MAELEELRLRLVRLVAKRCPHWSPLQREDVVQEALIKVERVLTRRAPDDPLPTAYLARCAHTAICDELRRARWRYEVATDEGEERTFEAGAPSPLRQAWSRQILEGVQSCLRGLRDDRRHGVWLHLQGYSAREAAELLGLQARQAENLIFRGRGDLRRCLRDRGIEP